MLGPSDDGGYYLIGLRKPNRRIFEEIDWSTDRVLEQTLNHAKELKLKVHLLPTWYDVDDRTSLRRLCAELLGPNEPTGGFAAPATLTFLREIIAREGRERICPANLAAVGSS